MDQRAIAIHLQSSRISSNSQQKSPEVERLGTTTTLTIIIITSKTSTTIFLCSSSQLIKLTEAKL
jgi:hypothetical protein